MRRTVITPRANWEHNVEEQGLSYYLTDSRPYWNESACYEFTAAEVDAVERATYELDRMCLQAVEYVLQNNLLDRFQIPRAFHRYVRESWDKDERTVYGRFDFAFDGTNLKMLEYNADTPTGLIEAAVIQWYWLQDERKRRTEGAEIDQFNTLHERLIEAWRTLHSERAALGGRIYFASIPPTASDEDFMTVGYLRDTAQQAGWQTEFIAMADIGWNPDRGGFVDLQERPIGHIFKLYPWEMMVREPFGKYLPQGRTRWLEAPWKMVLSNKAILTVLYELFPDSSYILPAAFEPTRAIGDIYVRKPLLGREGANTALVAYGEAVLQTEGPYTGQVVYQSYAELPEFDGSYPVIGSWMVNGYAAGIGIREGDTRITTNQSRFVPHCFS